MADPAQEALFHLCIGVSRTMQMLCQCAEAVRSEAEPEMANHAALKPPPAQIAQPRLAGRREERRMKKLCRLAVHGENALPFLDYAALRLAFRRHRKPRTLCQALYGGNIIEIFRLH